MKKQTLLATSVVLALLAVLLFGCSNMMTDLRPGDVYETDVLYTPEELFTLDDGEITEFDLENLEGTEVNVPPAIGGVTVTAIGGEVFAGAGLTAVTLPDTVESLGEGSFKDNPDLETVSFGTGLTSIGDEAFAIEDGSGSLTELDLPPSLETIGDDAFKGQPLTNITIGDDVMIGSGEALGTHTDDFKTAYAAGGAGAYVFEDGAWSKEGENGENGDNGEPTSSYFTFDSETGTITGYSDDGPKAVVIPTEIDGVAVTAIGNSAFSGGYVEEEGTLVPVDKGITSVVIPGSVTTIGNYSFVNNASLTSVTLNEGLQSIGVGAFIGTALTEIVMPDSLRSIGESAFASIETLESVTLNPGLEHIEDYAFQNTGITSISIPGSVTTIGQSAFENLPLTSLTLDEGIETIKQQAFMNHSLSELVIPASVKTIERNAFGHSDGNATAMTLTLNEGLETIGQSAFTHVPIETIVIPDSVTEIGMFAFIESGVKNLTLGTGLVSIGSYAFEDHDLTELVLPVTVETIGNRAFWQQTGPSTITSITIGADVAISDQMLLNNNDFREAYVANDRAAGTYVFDDGEWKVYEIGDTGPAGGYIFYIDEAGAFDWTYLEAAPELTEGTGIQWADDATEIGGDAAKTGIGDGQAATAAIVQHLEDNTTETDRAAQLADALTHNGFDDWFLPSKDELNLMYVNLHQQSVGGFADDSYWSSSEGDSSSAWMQFFNNGDQHNFSKFGSRRVRAIRAF